MFLRALLAFLILPGLAAGLLPVVLGEEPWLLGQFGEAWEGYSAGVPRWAPRMTPWRG